MDPKRVAWRGVQGPSLWLSPFVVLRSAFDGSFLCMAATLCSMCSSRKRPHSCSWAVLKPRCSLLNSFRNSWPLRVQSATQFEQLVLQVNSLALSPSMAKFPYWRVTNSSIIFNPDIFVPCFSSILVGNILCMHDLISNEYTIQEVRILTSVLTTDTCIIFKGK